MCNERRDDELPPASAGRAARAVRPTRPERPFTVASALAAAFTVGADAPIWPPDPAARGHAVAPGRAIARSWVAAGPTVGVAGSTAGPGTSGPRTVEALGSGQNPLAAPTASSWEATGALGPNGQSVVRLTIHSANGEWTFWLDGVEAIGIGRYLAAHGETCVNASEEIREH